MISFQFKSNVPSIKPQYKSYTSFKIFDHFRDNEQNTLSGKNDENDHVKIKDMKTKSDLLNIVNKHKPLKHRICTKC